LLMVAWNIMAGMGLFAVKHADHARIKLNANISGI
jgi:hypothetical protein